MIRPDISYTRYSAEINTSKFRVYYGSDQADSKTGEWHMVIWKNDKEVARYSNSELLAVAYGERPSDLMLAGLALYLSR
jgi:hypothetical protein